MNFSSEQNAIFAHFASGEGNLVIEAFAGTGKTTTIKAAFEHAPEARILYAVFNKRNQKEAEEKITDSRVEVKTLHSLGFAFIKRVWRNAKPDDEVETDRVLRACPQFRDNKEFIAELLKLVGFAKNTCIQPTRADMASICEAQDIDPDFISHGLAVLEASKVADAQGRISFNDMVWLPVAVGWVKPWYNLVCIDEAQDMNLPQLMMARAASSGRVIVVGDSRQAIYGFRGAVQDGMQMMKVTLRASGAKLSTTYRCPKAVVKIAAEIVPDYKAADSAPEGEVGYVNGELAPLVKVGDAILSRLNAPLMPLALQLLRKNIPARIEGRDIGRQLIGMVRTMKASSVPHFMERVEAWLAKQIERLDRCKNPEKKIEATRDIADTLKALAQDAKSVSDIEARVNSLFQDSDSSSKPAVVLSSVHKAKGLEWNRVFLLSDTFRKGKTKEEDNIYYVAVTRARQALFFVGGKGAQPETKPAVKADEAQVGKNCHVAESATSIAGNQALPQETISSGFEVLVPKAQVLHEVGNVISIGGKEIICTRVTDSGATFREISNKGAIHHLSACIDPTFILRKDQSLDGSKKQTGTEDDNDMATKKKTVAAPAAKNNSNEPAAQVSYAGRGERIAALVAKGKTDEEILTIIRKEFPGSSKSPVLKTIAGKRAKSKEDAKPNPKASAEKPTAKKPAAKAPAKKKAAKEAAPAAPESTTPAAPAIPPRPTPAAE